MERRVTSHTEEEEMNQRRRLLNLARKGDESAINRLLELYQVRVYSGEKLRGLKVNKSQSGPTKSAKTKLSTVTKREKGWKAPHSSRVAHSSKRGSKNSKIKKPR